jgi:predicted small secreted protein
MKKKLFALALVVLALGGCNTMEGVGRDISAVGDAAGGNKKK